MPGDGAAQNTRLADAAQLMYDALTAQKSYDAHARACRLDNCAVCKSKLQTALILRACALLRADGGVA